jgi:lipoyl(octanoyl) transferase
MTKQLFGRLQVCHDLSPHPAAMNMAIDEGLLESASIPTIRFYRWRSPALSFGYFGKFTDVATYAAERDLVRRWTGGGIVFHGEDLTYSIVIPASDRAFDESSIAMYEKIHRALCQALIATGHDAEVVGSARCADSRKLSGQRNVPTNNCFTNPVRADVMIDNRKIAGAAQRRTRRGLLQQGSIQGITLRNDFAQQFAQALSVNCSEFEINEQVLPRARDLAQRKYGTESWLRMR